MTLQTDQYATFQEAYMAAASQDRDLKVVGDSHLTAPLAAALPEDMHVWGSGNKDRVLIDFAGGTALKLGTTSEARNPLLEDFSILATQDRTSGWALQLPNVSRASINNVDIGTPEHPAMHYGGLCIDQLDDSTIDDGNIYARKTCFELGGGADLTIGGGVKMQNHRRPDFTDALPGAVGFHLRGGFGGLYAGSIHTIFCGIGWLIEGIGKANRELFLNAGVIVDSCLDDGIRAMPNSFGTLALTGVWSSSNGRQVDGDGLGIEANQSPIATVQITGGRFFNNKRGSGIVVNGGYLVVGGPPVCDFNRDHGLWVPNGGVTGEGHIAGRANGKALVNTSAAPNFRYIV